jgi:hypothetical protein
MRPCDAVGCFNTYNGKLWGSFLIKEDSCENALLRVEEDFCVQFTYLDMVNDEQQIQKSLQDWARGDIFILF